MFPRRFFGARYFAPRYFPQSEGETPVISTFPPAGKVAKSRVYVAGNKAAEVYIAGAKKSQVFS